MNLFNMTDKIEQQKKHCYNNILRMETDKLPKFILNKNGLTYGTIYLILE